MKTLVVHPANEKQDKALKAVFDALQVDYVEEDIFSKKTACKGVKRSCAGGKVN